MKKQGFTLIELMVVIVIMGILAAVAVPKLFGMIAKSKASEVGPAAGTYVKLQDAYVAEQGTKVGTWKDIGYVMRNTTNFYYCDAASGDCTKDTNTDSGYGKEVAVTGYVARWAATSLATLNDCAAASTWSLATSQNGSAGGMILYTAAIENETNCKVLTPNFERLNTASSTTSTTTGG
jgi:prepilin-type N-terminal cleavage/methylation domain-containing protein